MNQGMMNMHGGQMPMPMQQPRPTPNGMSQMPHGQSESDRYRAEIMSVFTGDKFGGANEQQKKQLVGTAIFRHVTTLVTPEYSPKITGMIIDLPLADLNYSVSTYETLCLKVKSAVTLLVDTGNMT